MKKIWSVVAVLALGAAAVTAQSVDSEIAERIAPVDSTCMQGDECSKAAPETPAAAPTEVAAAAEAAPAEAASAEAASAEAAPAEAEAAPAEAAPAAAETASAGRSGEDVYNNPCATCHAIGAAGAPMLGDAAAWEPRIAQGMDTLYTNALNGIRAMPAKGLCMTCSDDEIKAAVDYMVEKSK